MYSNSDKTTDWIKYENGLKYNNQLKPPYYPMLDTNVDFFNGNQWRNVEANGTPTPVFNIIKRAITFWVASITSSDITIKYEPLEYSDDDPNIDIQNNPAAIATAEVANLFDKFKMDNKRRDACFKAAIMGDVAAHLYFDMSKKPYGGAFGEVQGEICFELVNGSNVFFGNANNPNIDIQPYIIISGRDMVENLQNEAKAYKQGQEEINAIQSDKNYQEQVGDMAKIEIESDEYGKALYIITYRKDPKTNTIKVSKCTETAYIYKDIDTGLSHYPVAWLPWEKQENQYHGRALCTEIIPNQIFINRMFAMVMYHLMMAAFPKAIYDADRISAWTNEIGVAIPIKDLMPNENINSFAGYLQPGNMSNQIVQVIQLAIDYTKEMVGINDSALGNINPEQASGKAILATVQQASIPQENTKANLYEWVEDIGKICLDMMGTYYGQRPIVINQDGQKQIVQFDFSTMKKIWLNVRTDVGASSYWSEIANIGTLDNMLEKGLIDVIDYLESLPEGYMSNKQDLINRLKAKMEEAAQQDQAKQLQYAQMAKFVDALPPEVQEQLKKLPPEQMEKQVMQMMQQQAPQM
jgi:hypothetical protein